MMRLHLVCLACLCLLAAGLQAAELTVAVTAADIDAAQCATYVNGKALTPPASELVEVALGLRPEERWQPGKTTVWATGEVAGKERHFRVAFKRPIELGTLCTTFTGPTSRPLQPLTGYYVSYLKSTAAYPGDVTKDDQWVVLAPGEVKILPPGTKTRALRFSVISPTDDTGARDTRMGIAIPFTERYYSALNIGYAKKTGVDKKPEVWLGTWNEAQTVVGLVFLPLRTDRLQVEVLKQDAAEHAAIAPVAQWKRLPDLTGGGVKIYRIDRPFPTKGLRLTAPNWRWDSNFPMALPLVNLGEAAVAPTLEVPPPPFKIGYTMPMDGFAAVDVVEKKTGKVVRRIVGEVARQKGPVEERWDLKDEAGEMVPPGEYTLRGIARPPFKLTYQTTVYNAGQPAWWAPSPGKGGGGWLADHTPPFCAEAMGDTIWLGAQCTESGHAFIATDLDGNKLWGEHAVSWGFSGPERIVTDGRFGYLVNDSIIQRVDPTHAFAAKTIYTFRHTVELPGNGGHWSHATGGAAMQGDKLYIAYYAGAENWLKPSFISDTLDTKKSMPVIFLRKGGGKRQWKNDKIYAEGEYDELMQFYAAFLTERTPEETPTAPDMAIPSSTKAYFGDAIPDGPLAGTLTAVFKKPVPVGAVTVPDGRIKVYALRPGAKLPDNQDDMKDPDIIGGGDDDDIDGGRFDEAIWMPFTTVGKPGQAAIALAPEQGVYTTALRFQADRVVYALVTARRFADVAPQAERVFRDGQATPQGGWSVERPAKTPINSDNPAIMGMIWPQETPLRGIALSLPTSAVMRVDLWTGPANGDPKAALGEDAQWKPMGTLQPGDNWMGSPEIPTIHRLDFGEILPVRALRIVALAPAGAYRGGRFGIGGVSGPHLAGFQSIIAYHHLGADPENLPQILTERLTEYQVPAADEEKGEAKVLRHLKLKKPGNLTFDKNGTLYAVSDGQIVTVPLEGGESKVVITRDKLVEPSDLAFDADGVLYVADCGPKVIKVFDVKTGALLRTLGKPGGIQLGTWDPERFDLPTGLSIDSAGKLWITDKSYQPKRVVRMSRDGKVEKEFFGPTQYGGGGIMDPQNKSVVIYNGMKFVIDWKTYTWKLASILFRPGMKESIDAGMPDRTVYVKGKRYLIEDGLGDSGGVAAICMERNDIAVPMAAMGNLGAWEDVSRRPDLRKAFGALQRQQYTFVWADKNGDGAPQVDEVQIAEKIYARGELTVGEDLSFLYRGFRLRPSEILASGVPVYDLNNVETVPFTAEDGRTRRVWGTADGRIFCIGDRLIAANGKDLLWEYYDRWAEHEGFYHSGYGYDRPPGVLNQEHYPIGHFTLKNGQGKEEEYFVTNSDQGDWFCFTADGMLAGCFFGGPSGYGLRRWTMPEWAEGKVNLDDVRLGQEHYQGHVTTAEDGKLYAIAGHNHASVVLIDGLEQLQRLPLQTITVTKADVETAQAWTLQRDTLAKVRSEAKVAKMPFIETPVGVNAFLDDWPEELFVMIHDYWIRGFGRTDYFIHSQGALAYDEQNLYIAVRAMDDSPLANTAAELPRLFKHGDAVDVTLGLDPQADPKRKKPVAGDVRILLSQVRGKPVAVIYRPVVPGTPGNKVITFESPVGKTDIDVVTVLEEPEVVFSRTRFYDKDGWICEAAIPWKAIGVEAPPVGAKIRGDIGVLQSDQNGVATAGRLYWSGKTQTVICDVPYEARLSPSLWGEFYCVEPDTTMRFGPDEVDILPE